VTNLASLEQDWNISLADVEAGCCRPVDIVMPEIRSQVWSADSMTCELLLAPRTESDVDRIVRFLSRRSYYREPRLLALSHNILTLVTVRVF
jgi:hypothetical protein